MVTVAFILAEGSKLYGTEVATLRVLERFSNSSLSAYSIRENLHNSFHTWDANLKGPILKRIFHLAFRCNAQVLVSCNHYVSLILIVLSLVTKKKVVCWEHSEHHYARRYMRILKILLYRYAYGVISVNQSDCDHWKKVNKNVVKIWNLNGPVLRLSELNKKSRDIDLLYVGRFSKERGAGFFNQILEALYVQNQNKLTIALIGDDFSEINSVHFRRHNIIVSDFVESVDGYFRRSKCYMNPAIYESFGLSTYRALLNGVSVIAWDTTSSAAEFQEQPGFISVEYKNIDAFARAAYQAIASNRFEVMKDKDAEYSTLWSKILGLAD